MYDYKHEDLEEIELDGQTIVFSRSACDGVVQYSIDVYRIDPITEARLGFDLRLCTDETTARSVFALFTKENACLLWEDA